MASPADGSPARHEASYLVTDPCPVHARARWSARGRRRFPRLPSTAPGHNASRRRPARYLGKRLGKRTPGKARYRMKEAAATRTARSRSLRRARPAAFGRSGHAPGSRAPVLGPRAIQDVIVGLGTEPDRRRVDGVVASCLKVGDSLWGHRHVDPESQPASSIVSSSARLAAYRRASSMSAGSR
jgi:hypothetical protein